jgi:predicted ATPase
MVSGFSFGAAGELRSREYRATNVGFGLSYVLPVLVALLGVSRGGLVLIENPEAHLHPRGQTRLGELCARAAAAGVQVVIETHSDHVMDGSRIAIREGVLEASNAAFHYFGRTGEEIEVVSPSVDAEGRLSEWPAGFFDQTRRDTARLVRPKS